MSDYKVGQILFIIPAKSTAVIPIQVVERRISETVEGTAIKHVIKGPNPKSSVKILETIEGSVFNDVKEIRDLMIKNAVNAIDDIIKNASLLSQQAFSIKESVKQKDVSVDIFEQETQQEPMKNSLTKDYIEETLDVDEDNMIEIMLPNGQKQRAKLKAS